MAEAGAPTTDALLAFAGVLADAARAAILPHFRAAPEAINKAAEGFDPVTAADRGAEIAMRALLREHFPGHGVMGEEFGATPGAGRYAWLLDPIDGTRAFLAGLPLWGTLIALLEEGRPVLGVIDQGFLDERFLGWPGGAALVTKGTRTALRARACAGLSEAVLATTDPLLFEGEAAHAFARVRARARLTRYGCDCYAYAMAAMGCMDLVIESGLAPWDAAALIPVVEGAGGRVTDWAGAPAWSGEWFAHAEGRGAIVAAGDARTLEEALAVLAGP